MKFFKNYSLSIVLFIMFIVSWGIQGIFQYRHELDQAKSEDRQFEVSEFKDSFIASTFENWQSEFLQLFTMVVLTSFLIHKGSKESKDSDEKLERLIRKLSTKVDRLSLKKST